jgi:hypothetical protein
MDRKPFWNGSSPQPDWSQYKTPMQKSVRSSGAPSAKSSVSPSKLVSTYPRNASRNGLSGHSSASFTRRTPLVRSYKDDFVDDYAMDADEDDTHVMHEEEEFDRRSEDLLSTRLHRSLGVDECPKCRHYLDFASKVQSENKECKDALAKVQAEIVEHKEALIRKERELEANKSMFEELESKF